MEADYPVTGSILHAGSHRVRIAAPAAFIRMGYWKAKDGWRKLTEEEVDLCLQPITSSTNNALARGRTPLSALEKHEAVNALRSRQLATITSEIERYRDSVLHRIRHEFEGLTDQVNAHFLAEIRNRELILERRRQAPPEAGPIELWQGQIAALERSLSMARLNFSEATDFLQDLAGGCHLARTLQPCTILLALIADE